MKKWLISCVAAACEPKGVELEGILVFPRAQGLGKTLWFKRLANYDEGWLLEGATLNPSDKDSVKQAVSHWIVELGELESTFKKSDIDQLKAFVTKKTDELRLPYDRAFTTYQRRTAFYASVNAREFLTDTSGNRRFWVIPVKGIDVNHGVDMQQLWAEVKETMYTPGQKNWFLSPDERAQLQESNELYRTQSSVEDLILEHVDFGSDNTKPVQMTKLLRDLGRQQSDAWQTSKMRQGSCQSMAKNHAKLRQKDLRPILHRHRRRQIRLFWFLPEGVGLAARVWEPHSYTGRWAFM